MLPATRIRGKKSGAVSSPVLFDKSYSGSNSSSRSFSTSITVANPSSVLLVCFRHSSSNPVCTLDGVNGTLINNDGSIAIYSFSGVSSGSHTLACSCDYSSGNYYSYIAGIYYSCGIINNYLYTSSSGLDMYSSPGSSVTNKMTVAWFRMHGSYTSSSTAKSGSNKRDYTTLYSSGVNGLVMGDSLSTGQVLMTETSSQSWATHSVDLLPL